MAEFLWKKFSYLSGMLALGVVLGLVVFLCNSEIADFDLWLHLKTGEVIVEHGFIPTQDIFSCTMHGQPWNNHEWLFQVIFYLFLSFGGYDGLFTAQAILVALTFITLLFLSDIRSRHYFTAFLLFILALVFQTRLTMRPDLFSLFFFSFYLYILSVHLEKRISAWILFAVQIAWVNIHGFFIFGPLLILLSMFCEFLKRRVKLPWEWNQAGRLSDEEFHRLKFALVATSLACLVNPQFIKGALYPVMIIFQMSGESSVFFSYIQELRKPITWATLFSQQYLSFKILALVSFYSFVVNRKRIDISALFLWLIFLGFALQAVRNLTFFGIVAYLVTILNFSEYRLEWIMPFKFKRRELKLITICLLNILLIAWMVRFGDREAKRVFFDFKNYQMKSYWGGISARNYPWEATDFINTHHLRGNFLNDFNSGAFLIGRCSPHIRVFIDGRTELHGPRFFKDYVAITDGDKEAFARAVTRYQLTGAFLSTAHNRTFDKLLKHLRQDKDWVLVYVDHDGVIFLKDVPENRQSIAQLRKDERSICFEPLDFGRLGPRGVFPYREVKRAYNLEAMDLDDLALEQVREALGISPGAAEPYYIRGLILRKRGDHPEAFKNFRIAVMLSPGDQDMRYHLGLSYAALGDHLEAVREYEKVLESNKERLDVLVSCAESYLARGEYKKTLETARRIFSLNPKSGKGLIKLADNLAGKKRTDEALEVYRLSYKINPRDAHIFYRIGLCFQDLGETKKAREAFLRGLKIDPSSTEIREALSKMNTARKP